MSGLTFLPNSSKAASSSSIRAAARSDAPSRCNTTPTRSRAATRCRAWAEKAEARAQPLRLKGPAIESIKLDAKIDATDSLEHPDQNTNAVAFGIAPQLAALKSLMNPSTVELLALNALSQSGTLEILPSEAHNYHVEGCDPFSSKPAAPPSQRAKKTSTTGGEE